VFIDHNHACTLCSTNIVACQPSVVQVCHTSLLVRNLDGSNAQQHLRQVTRMRGAWPGPAHGSSSPAGGDQQQHVRAGGEVHDLLFRQRRLIRGVVMLPARRRAVERCAEHLRPAIGEIHRERRRTPSRMLCRPLTWRAAPASLAAGMLAARLKAPGVGGGGSGKAKGPCRPAPMVLCTYDLTKSQLTQGMAEQCSTPPVGMVRRINN